MERPVIVDAHVHLFPPEFARDRAALAARDPWFDLTYGAGTGHAARMATVEELVAALGALAPVVAVLRERGRPALVHVSEPVGHAYAGKGTATPDRLLPFLLAYPELRVVAAHWGGGLPFYELMPEVADAARNLWYDSAASTYLYRFDVFPSVAALAGSLRILWGTDWPLLRQAPFLRRTRAAGLDEHALAAILGDNARRLYWGEE